MEVAARMKNGAELAREDLLEKHRGKLSLELLYEKGCFERETVVALQKFIHAGVSIIGASFCLFGHIPILPLTEASRIITFNTASNPDAVLNKRFAFSTNVEIKDEARKMAAFAYETLGGRRAVLVHLDTPFGRDYDKYFTREFERLGGKRLFNVSYAPDARRFEDAIRRTRGAAPDLVVTALFGVPLGIFLKELRAAGITAPILGNYEMEDHEVLDAAGAAAEGVIFSSSELDLKTNGMLEFERRYIRRFAVAPDAVVTNAYDDVTLGVEAAIACGGERECMSDALSHVRDYHGASGIITIKPSGATDKPTIFKVIRNRTFVRYEPESSPS